MNAQPSSPHPTDAQWADYLYGELTPDARRELDAHAELCPDCRTRLAHRRETQTALDAWKVRPRARPLAVVADYARWAVAAGLVLGLGWLGGRLATPAVPDAAQIRAELVPALEQSLRVQFDTRLQTELAAAEQRHQDRLVELAQSWATGRAEDQETTHALYQRTERQRRADFAALRRDLETVAVVAQDAIGNTQQELTRLAVNRRGDNSLP